MSRVFVVTDSTADFPEGEAERLGIGIVSLYMRFGKEEFRDRVNLSSDEFFARLKKDETPITSQPTPDDFLKAYKRAGSPKILSIHISSKLSGTVNSALQSGKVLNRSFDIRVVDSRNLALGLGFLAMKAAEMAKTGADIDAVEAEVRCLIPRIRLYGVLDTLHYLAKDGRIGKVSSWMGSVLNVKPIIKIQDGEVQLVERVRTREKAVVRLLELVQKEGNMARLGVIHVAAEDEAKELAIKLKEIYPSMDIPIVQTGTVIGTHSGPGLVGICGLLK